MAGKDICPAQWSRSVEKSSKKGFLEEVSLGTHKIKSERGRPSQHTTDKPSAKIQAAHRATRASTRGNGVLLPSWEMQAQQGPGSADHPHYIHLGTCDENQKAWALT